ncbi:MAG: nucleotidyltransferase domain-containing protein [Ignavibacteriales bacterium]|nr:nucleotidyltransferase domain-containing protein [Ignavibacteriales bacterium]
MEHLNQTEKQLLSELKDLLVRNLGLRLNRFMLFGSKARGDSSVDSDLDVAIVVDGLDRNLKREIFDLVADLELKYLYVISSLVLSTEEFNKLLERERRIALDIIREGVQL